jgi:hypothetical protein
MTQKALYLFRVIGETNAIYWQTSTEEKARQAFKTKFPNELITSVLTYSALPFVDESQF